MSLDGCCTSVYHLSSTSRLQGFIRNIFFIKESSLMPQQTLQTILRPFTPKEDRFNNLEIPRENTMTLSQIGDLLRTSNHNKHNITIDGKADVISNLAKTKMLTATDVMEVSML